MIPIKKLKTEFPKTAEYLLSNKKRLEDRESGKFRDAAWHRFGRSQNLGIQGRAKICVPRLVDRLHGAFDRDGSHFLDNVDVGGVTVRDGHESYRLIFLLAVINSSVAQWYFPHISAPFRGGFRSANRQYLSQLPLPAASFIQQATIELLVDYLLWLHRQPSVIARENPRDPVMLAFWEQVINALVYRLFFPVELAAARLDFFRLVDEAALPPVPTLITPDGKRPCVNDAERLASLRAHFERLSASNSPLAAALFTLGGLDLVCLIEGRT